MTSRLTSGAKRLGKLDFSLLLMGGFAAAALAGLVVFLATLDPGIPPGAQVEAEPTQPPTSKREPVNEPVAAPPKEPPEIETGPSVKVPSLPLNPLPPPKGAAGKPGEQAGKDERKPEPQPEPPAKPEPRPKPVADPGMPKLPVPEPAKQAEAEKLIKDIFAADYARKKPPDLAALASKLITEGMNTQDNPAAQYVLFREAADLAARGNDFALAVKAIDQLALRFSVNPIDLKLASLASALQGQPPPATLASIAGLALELTDEAVEEDNYPAANRMLEIAELAAKKTTSGPLLSRVQMRGKEVDEIARQYADARPAAEILQKKPDDPEASQKWGRFLAFFKGNFGAGLPLLAQGVHPAFYELAEKDLARPTGPKEQLELGDGWWDLADTQPPAARKHLVVRARYWYEQAVGTLSGFTKTRVEKRIKDADQLLGRADGSGDKPTPVPPVKDPYAQNMQMGQYWFKVGNYPRAVESFTAALKVKPDDPKASEALKQSQYYLYMAAGYQRANLGDFQGAGQMFAKALEEKPDDQAATSALAALEQAMKGGGIFKTRGKGMGGK